jgi:hypothetical protein
MMAECARCGSWFEREPHENWKRLCFSCWLSAKERAQEERLRELESTVRNLSDYISVLESEELLLRKRLAVPMYAVRFEEEFLERFTSLVRFCHPDRNSGDPAAHTLTIWLLEAREELKRRRQPASQMSANSKNSNCGAS